MQVLVLKFRDVNKDSRLKDKDKDQGLEFKDPNQRGSSQPALVMQQTRIIILWTGVVGILCFDDIFFIGRHNIIATLCLKIPYMV